MSEETDAEFRARLVRIVGAVLDNWVSMTVRMRDCAAEDIIATLERYAPAMTTTPKKAKP